MQADCFYRASTSSSLGRSGMTRPCFSLIASLLYLFCSAPFSLTACAQAPPKQFSLKAESPRFWELLDRNAHLDRVATGFGFTEGPVWDERGFLYVSDEEQNKIFKVY